MVSQQVNRSTMSQVREVWELNILYEQEIATRAACWRVQQIVFFGRWHTSLSFETASGMKWPKQPTSRLTENPVIDHSDPLYSTLKLKGDVQYLVTTESSNNTM